MNMQEEIDQLRLQAARYEVSTAKVRLEAALLDRSAAQMRYDRERKISNPPESTSMTSVRATIPTEKLTTLRASDPYP